MEFLIRSRKINQKKIDTKNLNKKKYNFLIDKNRTKVFGKYKTIKSGDKRMNKIR